jgi:hypothetical protein
VFQGGGHKATEVKKINSPNELYKLTMGQLSLPLSGGPKISLLSQLKQKAQMQNLFLVFDFHRFKTMNNKYLNLFSISSDNR